MDSFNDDELSLETEEAYSIEHDIRLQSMGKAFRTIELCIALFFLLWIMLHLPSAIRIVGELLRRLLLLLLLSPLIISMLFGVCVATLMVKSYRVSSQNVAKDNAGTNFYENMIDVGEVEVLLYEEVNEEVVYEDKEMVIGSDCDKSKTPLAATCDVDVMNQTETAVEESIRDDVVLEKQYSSPRDLLNDADFKNTIDEFIKKQRELLKMEKRTCFAISPLD